MRLLSVGQVVEYTRKAGGSDVTARARVTRIRVPVTRNLEEAVDVSAGVVDVDILDIDHLLIDLDDGHYALGYQLVR